MRSYLYLLMILFLTGCAVDPDLFTDIIKPKLSLDLKNTILPKKTSSKVLNINDNIFIWPITGEIVNIFGPHSDGIHNDGVNIKAEYGAPINPSYNGEVIYVDENSKDFGKLILISHPNGYVSSYAHLSKINVYKGAYVFKNDIIGEIGETGIVKFPQLYFEIRNKEEPINPEILIN